ncbi:hypothetical protein EBAPG3_012945 [Nitrosospira lacus]|uniref:DUF3899 domain-containing protein n=1 Tax=Nitrosospira lacus TaxID=1288494 RepID=A0A1W6SS30_9PROT|nr:hypothetical protein [Nitrosospira lacus]ARO88601.1 hypothetical protein EBAPG3_012945 [Nitrosospira lacus]
MKQLLFHVSMLCLFLPILWMIGISLNEYGFPLMEKYHDKSIKFFVALPYCLLIAASLYGSAWMAERLSGSLVRKFGKPGENHQLEAGWPDKVFDPASMEKNRSVFMRNVDGWLKDNVLARVIFGLIIGLVIVM